MSARLLLLVIAAVVFAVAALWQPGPPRVSLVALGLCLLTVSFALP